MQDPRGRRSAPGFTPELAERIGYAITALGGLVSASRTLGRTKTTIAKWRDGVTKISLHDVGELAAAAGVDSAWLAFGDVERPARPQHVQLTALRRTWDFWMPVIIRIDDRPSQDELRERFLTAVAAARSGIECQPGSFSAPSPLPAANGRGRAGGGCSLQAALLLDPQALAGVTARPLAIDEWSEPLVRDTVKWLAHRQSDAISFLTAANDLSGSIVIVEFDRNGRNAEFVSASVTSTSQWTIEMVRRAMPLLRNDDQPRAIALSVQSSTETLQLLVLPLPTGGQKFAAVVF